MSKGIELRRGGYWTEKEGREAVRAWKASGESLTRFAARHGVGTHRIRWWCKRLGDSLTVAAKPLQLVPVEILAGAPARDDVRPIEIEVAGRRVRVGADFDEGTLVRLVRVLESLGRC